MELHVRLLLALPLLIMAELTVHQRMRPVVGQFLDRGLIPDVARPQFDAAIASTVRLRNSVAAEVLLIAFVYIVGVGLIWRTQVALGVTSCTASRWREPAAVAGRLVAGRHQPAAVPVPALAVVFPAVHLGALPLARLKDPLAVRAHASGSRRGPGLSGAVAYAFTPVLLAQGAMLAGMMASQIFFAGATLPEFKLELIGTVALMVFTILGPLLVFGPQLEAAKRAGLRDTARWRSATCASSTASGCAAARRPASRSSAAPTSSRSPTWATATRW